MIKRIEPHLITIQGFDAIKGNFYEIIGPDDGERIVLECIRSGNVAVKYFKFGIQNVWILKGPGELLFCQEENLCQLNA